MAKNQWIVLYRQDRCIGCGTCIAACKAWNHEKRGDVELNPISIRINIVQAQFAENADDRGTMRENWIRLTTEEMGTNVYDMQLKHMVLSCMHCDAPACVPVCPVKRIYKDLETGIVTTDPSIACIGCGLCKAACPIDAPQFWNQTGGKENGTPVMMTKCDLCAERLKDGKKTACAAACPVRAIKIFSEKELNERYPEAVKISEVKGFEKTKGIYPNYYVLQRNK